MGGLTALDMFKLLTCLHMHRAPCPSLYMACAAALAPKLGELQYACAARVQGPGSRVPGFRVPGFQLEGRGYGERGGPAALGGSQPQVQACATVLWSPLGSGRLRHNSDVRWCQLGRGTGSVCICWLRLCSRLWVVSCLAQEAELVDKPAVQLSHV